MAIIKYDFKTFFEKEVKILIKKYKSLITQKRGIIEDDAPHNAKSTIKKKGVDHWLVDTGDLRRNGFKSKAGRMEASVYANPARHKGKGKNQPTYAQLFNWHTRKYSGFFRLPVASRFQIRMQREYIKQTQEQITSWLKKQNANNL